VRCRVMGERAGKAHRSSREKVTGEGRPGEAVSNRLQTLTLPTVQVALDVPRLTSALSVAAACYRSGVRMLEAGTPLVKNEGLRAVSRLKRKFGKAVIVADLKTLDAGWLEVELAAVAGADVVTISGLADSATVEGALGAAKKYGVATMIDMLGVKRLLPLAKRFERRGADAICIHLGLDAQRATRDTVARKLGEIARIAKSVSIPVAVAGGIVPGSAKALVEAGARVLIVGSAVYSSRTPGRVASSLLREVSEARQRL